MLTEKLVYYHEEVKCKGFVAYDETIPIRRPVILVVHAWRGQDDFVRQKAVELATLGYVGFAIDMFGIEKSVTDEEAPKLMMPLFLDRQLLQNRAKAAVDFISRHPLVDPSNIGAIGFCFGGLVVYELLRSGADLKGVACFHGVFVEEREGQKAKTIPVSPAARGKLLIMHGHDDPSMGQSDLRRIETEMTEAKIDWQIHIYGHTAHAFTNPLANDPKKGKMYNPVSANRAWRSMQLFFDECFS